MITLVQGDITKIKCDVIVNAANTSLLGGGGVDGAIHRAGGKEILAECRKIRDKQGGCKTGDAVITTAGKLPCKKVIHTVGPVWNHGTKNEKILLADCYRNSLNLAMENCLKRIAFPNISTGVYLFPKKLAAEIASKTIQEFLKNNDFFDKILFVCYDSENYEIYKRLGF